MSIYHEAPTEAKTPPLGEEPTHLVHNCQYYAEPRRALCGAHCADEDETFAPDTLCVVCADLVVQVWIYRACERCRG